MFSQFHVEKLAPRAEIVLMPIGLCERFGVTHKAFFAYPR